MVDRVDVLSDLVEIASADRTLVDGVYYYSGLVSGKPVPGYHQAIWL